MKKTLTLGLLVILSLSIIAFNYEVQASDSIPPAVSIIAPYNSGVHLDCSYLDWDSSTEGYLDLYEFGSPSQNLHLSSARKLTVTINFAYNETFLFFYAFFPGDQGDVKAADIHFFGKEGQDDGVHMYAYMNSYFDIVFTESGPPIPDEDNGGSNDASIAMLYQSSNGTIFEGAKKIKSGDRAGKDIDLDYGQAIAVEIVAWIDVFPEGEPPNFGSMSETELNYIRLDIGANIGDPLDIYAPSPEEFFPDWVVGSKYEAPYVDEEAVIDGVANETAWNSAREYDITLSFYNFSTGYFDPSNILEVTLKMYHNGEYYFFFVAFYDEFETEGDFVGFLIGKSQDMLNDSSPTDMIMISSFMYEDAFLPWDNSEPIPDEFEGGVLNGEGNVTYRENHRYAEFKKPLVPSDPAGADIDISTGERMYIILMVAQNSYDGPNYFEFYDDGGKPAFLVNSVDILTEGDSSDNDGTITLGFSYIDLLLISGFLTPFIISIYLKKKKKKQ
ncbi:MAG: hypothetical protein ACTSSG_04650 [Candidatus Heimdallarchaeaceae archaeon]